ncbi:MAG: hypothetical protein KC506_00245 [Nanoarchaeota archaeon]|nr:hypothetical protein [Nanoarchaeota archaeon]
MIFPEGSQALALKYDAAMASQDYITASEAIAEIRGNLVDQLRDLHETRRLELSHYGVFSESTEWEIKQVSGQIDIRTDGLSELNHRINQRK